MNFYYEGIRRLDWSFGNPNHAAAFIAMLMMATWALAYWNRRWGFWVALAIFAGLGVCLVQTFSRGGLVAAGVGSVVLLTFAPRPWPRIRIGFVVGLVAAFGICASLGTATERYSSSWQGDASVLNRLELWRHVPRMILDAPGGWGLGQSQTAYMQWYQGVDREERFLNLVSLHFTLLAELNWLWRIAYLGLLAIGFVLTFPGRFSRPLAVPFSIWSVFCVAGIFTHFSQSWPVYMLPLVALAIACLLRWHWKIWPGILAFLSGGLACALAFLVLTILGLLSESVVSQGGKQAIVIGAAGAKPAAWVVISTKILGRNYGKTLRRHLLEGKAMPALGFVMRPEYLPSNPDAVVLCGTVDAEAIKTLVRRKPQRVLLLNPDIFPEQLAEIPSVLAIFGEFAPSNVRSSWEKSKHSVSISGAGNYLKNWPTVLDENLGKQ